MGPKTKRQVLSHLIEFFIIGVIMGVAEDLLAIHFATNVRITWHVFKVAFLVALPFAIISEIVVDLKIFRKLIRNNHKRK